jgi:hypothetical protein
VRGYKKAYGTRDYQIALNVFKLMTVWDFLGKKPLPRDFARHVVVIQKDKPLEQWLDESPTGTAHSYGYLLHHTLQRGHPRSDLALHPLPEPVLPVHRHPRLRSRVLEDHCPVGNRLYQQGQRGLRE